MNNRKRRKSDRATKERREMADKNLNENRDKNDLLTKGRRIESDRNLIKNRARNDGITINRREAKDGNKGIVLAFSLTLIILAIAALFVFL